MLNSAALNVPSNFLVSVIRYICTSNWWNVIGQKWEIHPGFTCVSSVFRFQSPEWHGSLTAVSYVHDSHKTRILCSFELHLLYTPGEQCSYGTPGSWFGWICGCPAPEFCIFLCVVSNNLCEFGEGRLAVKTCNMTF